MSVKLTTVCKWLDQILSLERFNGIDAALNGLQVGNREQEIENIALACDACDEVIHRAKGCQLLLVHHGLFWGAKPQAVTQRIYNNVKLLIEQNCALYAAHLPLDAHPSYGNNVQLAELLNLQDRQAFAHYKGVSIGCRGSLNEPLRLLDIARLVFPLHESPQLFSFGSEYVRQVGICSGSGCFALEEAIENRLDLLITGDVNHSDYHLARESGISLLAGGHYNSETVGVQALGKVLCEQFKTTYRFIDFPTGL